MPLLTIYFKVHAAPKLGNYTPGKIGISANYFDAPVSKEALDVLCDTAYLPANEIVAAVIKKYKGKFKLAFSICGLTLDLFARYRPDVLKSFQQLAATGCVEFLGETWYNSLSCLYSKAEFKLQAEKHMATISKLFNQKPIVFRNTDLLYNNDLGSCIAGMGYRAIVCEGTAKHLYGRDVNQCYHHPTEKNLCLLLRNMSLSNDIAFHFGNTEWNEHPLTAEKFASWIHQHAHAQNINLMIDYETFGIHKSADTGIFDFLEALPGAVLQNEQWTWAMPTEVVNQCMPADVYNITETVSLRERNGDGQAWYENTWQNNMLKKIYSLENLLHKSADATEEEQWRQLQNADYFYAMPGFANQDFTAADEAHKTYINILTDFEIRLIEKSLLKFKAGNQLHPGKPIY